MGPRFSGKVREKPQRREWKWGDYETKTFAIGAPAETGSGLPIIYRKSYTHKMSAPPFQRNGKQTRLIQQPTAVMSIGCPRLRIMRATTLRQGVAA